MKAVTLQNDGIKIVDTSVPSPSEFQVLIKVYACCLNRSDLLETQGQSFGHMGSDLKILGGEFAGEVIELGSKVSNLAKGDKVMCRGGSGWAEYALAHHLRCVKFQNEQLNWEKASSIQGSLQTMHDAIVTNGKFKKGQSIFIQGASSGVGLIGLQIGKCLGASLIFGSSSNQTKLQKLSEFGADHLVDINKSNWKDVILDKTDGKGVDLVIDMLSGDFTNLNMEVTKINGHLINVGRLAGINSYFDHDLHAKRRIHYIGTTGRTRSIEENYLVSKMANDDLWNFVLNDKIKHPIDSVFELIDAKLALKKMNDNEHFGKIILKT